VFFVGDSFVAGVGDPEHRGWVGRLAARSDHEGVPITAYNLGVRRDTSDDVLRRWSDEVAVRRGTGSEDRMVVSFGVNDTTVDTAVPRVAPDRSVANLRAVVDGAAEVGLPLLVVGPPPVGDPAQNRWIATLDQRFRAACADAAVPYVPVYAALMAESVWADEVGRGDGSHPAAKGYALLAELVMPAWRHWLGVA
jgi:acyl-CoA thioesterase-1